MNETIMADKLDVTCQKMNKTTGQLVEVLSSSITECLDISFKQAVSLSIGPGYFIALVMACFLVCHRNISGGWAEHIYFEVWALD